MTKRQKLLDKARSNPSGLSFAEFEVLLEQSGWIFKRQSVSHRVWKAPTGQIVPVQAAGGKAKEYQVRQALKIMESSDV
jgi:predicted RNA binding protein YcfA (HicA-like mRNA interferase family)